jgi:hypothetical protein
MHTIASHEACQPNSKRSPRRQTEPVRGRRQVGNQSSHSPTVGAGKVAAAGAGDAKAARANRQHKIEQIFWPERVIWWSRRDRRGGKMHRLQRDGILGRWVTTLLPARVRSGRENFCVFMHPIACTRGLQRRLFAL